MSLRSEIMYPYRKIYKSQFIVFMLNFLAFTNSEFYDETFGFHQNKRILLPNYHQLKSIRASSVMQCGLHCQQYGESCCGGYYVNSTEECRIGISNCCHAEWEDDHNSTVFYRNSKYVGKCHLSNISHKYQI